MKITLVVSAALISGLAIPLAVRAAPSPLSHTDRVFVDQALNGNTEEIDQAQIFADSSDPLVSAFAQRMATDHGQANTALIAIANEHGMSVKGQAPSLPYTAGPHAASMSAQKKATIIAGQPPRDYFAKQITAHEQAISLYRHEIAGGSNRQVVSYARKTLPVIEQHLALARKDLHAEQETHHDR